MAAPDSVENAIPVTFDVGAIGMQLVFQSRFADDFFTGGDIAGNGDADAQRYDAQIEQNFHGIFLFMAVAGDFAGKGG